MTITELYNYAVSLGIENLPITINYDCSDDYYSVTDEPFEEKNIDANNKTVIFNLNVF